MPRTRVFGPVVFLRVVTVALGATLFSERFGARQLLGLDQTVGTPMMASFIYWFSLLAPAFFLWTFWAASNVFARVERGDAFGPAMVRGLREIGASLMLGAFCAIVVQPTIIFLIANGSGQMRGATFNFTIENLTLVVVGAVLVLLAREGQALKASLDEIV
jgi:hypothetical protein